MKLFFPSMTTLRYFQHGVPQILNLVNNIYKYIINNINR